MRARGRAIDRGFPACNTCPRARARVASETDEASDDDVDADPTQTQPGRGVGFGGVGSSSSAGIRRVRKSTRSATRIVDVLAGLGSALTRPG